MNRDELLLYVGQSRLPADLQRALDEDEELRAYFDELQSAARHLGTDDDFTPDYLSADIFAARVDAVIRRRQKTPNAGFHWRRVLPYAAAVVLGITSYFMADRLSNGSGPVQTGVVDSAYVGEVAPLTDETELVDDDMVNLLIEDYGREAYFDASERLLDDLTDEQWEYLEKNFDVNEVLI
jgi:hypothetical protein